MTRLVVTYLGRPWGGLAASWGCSWGLLKPLGLILAPLGGAKLSDKACWYLFGAALGRCCGLLGLFLGPLETSWVDFGASWRAKLSDKACFHLFGAPLGRCCGLSGLFLEPLAVVL